MQLEECIVVELLVPADEVAAAAVRFSQSGILIRRCGSGILAAAHTLHREIGLPNCLHLQTPSSLVEFAASNDSFSFFAPSLRLRPNLPPYLVAGFFDAEPKALCASGGHQDYWILEFESEALVRHLKPRLETITMSTQRAVIATAASEVGRHDYVLRYFAPQYGVAEDPATGSANLVLAHYWQNILHKPRVSGLQVSASGGEFHVQAKSPWTHADRHLPRMQIISGRTRLAG